MRNEFVDAETIEEAKELAPWAQIVVEVEGGFHAFENPTDYFVWKKQV